MGKLKRWAAAGGIALLLLLGGAVAAFYTVDPAILQPLLVASVQNATGRTLTLGGPVHITRSLWPTIELNDVSLANIPGGSRPHMAHAERIAVTLSLPALLQHRIAISHLALTGPDILFETVDGAPNWRFDLPGTAAPKAPSGPSSTPYALRIRATQVVNGMVTWHLPARTKVLGIRSMAVRHHLGSGAIDMAGMFVYSDNQPFDLRVAAHPTETPAWATRLDFSAFDTTASATGTMDLAGAYDLQVEGTSGSLERLNALLPEMRLPAVHGLRLSSRIGNGRRPGDLPAIGATRLHLDSASLGALHLAASDATIDKPGGTATLSGAARFGTQGFTLSGTVGVPLHPDDRVSLPVDLVAKAAPAPNAASGTAGVKGRLALATLAFEGLDGAVSLATPSLAGLRPLAGPGLPALTDVAFDGHLVLPASLAQVRFSGARLASTQGTAAGDGLLLLGTPPALTAKLTSDRLDLGAMLAAFGAGPAPARPSRTVIPDTPIDWSVLKGPTLDLSARLASLAWQDETWRGVDLRLLLKGGRLQDASLNVPVAGGSPVALSLSADTTVVPVPVHLVLNAPSLPLALVARQAGLPGPVSGAARVEARLQASGDSLHALAATLDGTASLAATDGRLGNAAFVRLAGAALTALGIQVPGEGETVLRCLGVAGSFAHGVGRLAPIAMETTFLSLNGTGQVDLGRETLSLQLHPLARVSGSMVSVPVTVQGPFRDLSGKLDADGLQKVGLFFDGLFGGDTSTACADAGLAAPR